MTVGSFHFLAETDPHCQPYNLKHPRRLEPSFFRSCR